MTKFDQESPPYFPTFQSQDYKDVNGFDFVSFKLRVLFSFKDTYKELGDTVLVSRFILT